MIQGPPDRIKSISSGTPDLSRDFPTALLSSAATTSCHQELQAAEHCSCGRHLAESLLWFPLQFHLPAYAASDRNFASSQGAVSGLPAATAHPTRAGGSEASTLTCISAGSMAADWQR